MADPLQVGERGQGVVPDDLRGVVGRLRGRVEPPVGHFVQDGRVALVPDAGEDRDRQPAGASGQLEVVEPRQVGHGPAAADDDQGVERPLPVSGEGRLEGLEQARRGGGTLEGRPEEEELAQAGAVQPVGLLAEVAESGRGLRADHGHADEVGRRR